MKKYILILFVFATAVAFAQTPQLLNYQGIARNGNGILANSFVKLRFTIHDVTASGTPVYQETVSAVPTNAYGLFTTQIGSGTPNIGTFGALNWGSGAKYLQVEIDPSNGSSFTDLGTTQLVSVPYALYAEKANVPGVAGPAGATGPTGPTGANGNNGATGVQGVTGATGNTGATGPVNLVAPTFQVFTSSNGVYTTPQGVLYIRVRMIGGGGGGQAAGSGTTPGADGSNGASTTFGTSLLTANGGTKGANSVGGAGGSGTINSPAWW